MAFFFIMYRKELHVANDNTADIVYPQPSEAIKSKGAFAVATIIFLAMIAALVLHGQLGWSVALIGTAAAILTLLTNITKAWKLLKKVDWLTILFFIGLFILIGGASKSGLIADLASMIPGFGAGETPDAVSLSVFSVVLSLIPTKPIRYLRSITLP